MVQLILCNFENVCTILGNEDQVNENRERREDRSCRCGGYMENPVDDLFDIEYSASPTNDGFESLNAFPDGSSSRVVRAARAAPRRSHTTS